MRWAFLALVLVHGLIHLLGAAKGFGLADLSQLANPISTGMAVAWLAASLLLLITAFFLAVRSRCWWVPGFLGALVSQAVILTSWSDAWFGTVANVFVLAGVTYGFASRGPLSFFATYGREVRRRLGAGALAARHSENPARQGTDTEAASPSPTHRSSTPPTGSSALLVSEDDLNGLPDPVQRYLRRTGSVGQPWVHHFRANWRGRIRGGPEDPWMEFTAEQYNFPREPSRFFLMAARRGVLPVDVFHAFRDGRANMQVRLLSLFPIADARGPEMTRAETVTLLNDICLLAPGALLEIGAQDAGVGVPAAGDSAGSDSAASDSAAADSAVRHKPGRATPSRNPSTQDTAVEWESVDAFTARVHYTVGANTVSAALSFNEAGELVDFVSDDRLASSSDGKQLTPQRWSTPVGNYREFGPRRAAARGEGRWHAPEGSFAYIELELLDLEINGGWAHGLRSPGSSTPWRRGRWRTVCPGWG